MASLQPSSPREGKEVRVESSLDTPVATPFKVDLSSRVPHMLDLIGKTVLPEADLPAAHASSNMSLTTGISVSTLKQLQTEWTTSFNWTKEQEQINTYHHFTTQIGSQKVHFIHEKSSDPNAIPLILLHGWPGSFLEMLHLVDALKSNTTTQSFHLIVPSLPGFAFSSPAPDGWTISDTATLFNTLMTQVLGYKSYAAHGTDWGSGVAFDMHDQFNEAVKAVHLNFLPFFSSTPEELAAQGITLTGDDAVQEERAMDFANSGIGYYIEQTTEVNTVGLALYDNPVGQLSWLAEKFIIWSDPRRGNGPSFMTDNEILRHVSLYYLTQTFDSAAFVYAQNPDGFSHNWRSSTSKQPLLYSNFRYNILFYPQKQIASIANLVYYSSEFFPAVDNPAALAADIRLIGKFFKP
ncbi:alpha/beta-hydrolase [Trichoderma citrinoviride]|uniref:Alpha/beta-hydrolase n=1 Tax=Trichoderma citrinoviride TaxID=58853 RepID=A0A2T4B1P5_9HYPO|nr:alpha/beta-hydrolase [Trichoderma citrinoviride]PTB63158.1 alpha/beta-hydrolase [Trichoderma citrinoviride]